MNDNNRIQNMIKLLCSFALLSAFYAITGCNDGLGSSTPSDDQGTNFSGHLYYHESRYGEDKLDAYIKLDLANLSSTIMSTDFGWRYSTANDESLFLAVDPSLTIIYLYHRNGTLKGSLDLGYTIIGIPRLSPDNEYIAVQFKNNYARKYLAIIDIEGNAIAAIDINEDSATRSGVQGVDWTPDGTVIFAAYGKIYELTDIESEEVKLINSLESEFDIFSIRVSPDGSKLAFLANDSYLSRVEGDLYTMNIDGSGLKQIALLEDVTGSFSNPAWGPESRFLAVQFIEDWANAECGEIWLLDNSLDNVVYIDGETSEIEGGYKIDTADYEVNGLCSSSGLDWL